MNLIERLLKKTIDRASSKKLDQIKEKAVYSHIERISKTMNFGNRYFSGQSNGSKWAYGMSANAPSTQYNHASLRQQARSAMQDSTAARSVVSRFGENVADTGLTLDLMPNWEILGITEDQAVQWARDVEKRFGLWASDKKSNRREVMTFNQSHRFAVNSQQRDGEYFVRLYYTNDDKSLTNPLQFEFIDPEQIRGDAITSSLGPSFIPGGIEYDSRGREKKYNIWIIQNEKYELKSVPRVGPASKRVYMIHGFAPEYAGQTRGFSPLSHALQEFENLTDFTSAHIKKAISQAMIGGFVKPSKDAPASNPYEGITEQAGPFGTQTQTSEEVATVQDTGESFELVPEANFKTASNLWITNLNAGEDFQSLNNTAPVAGYNEFVNTIISSLSASMGQPVEITLMKFNNNYSSTRGTLLLFWRICEIWRQELASDFLMPVFEMWLSGEIAAGRVSAPGWSDPIMKKAWLNSRWYGPPMPNIDPQRTANASKIYAELGAETLSSIARNHNGSNYDDNASKLKREYETYPRPPWDETQENINIENEDN